METIDDIRSEEGNPRAGGPVGGKPRSVFTFFADTSGARFVSLLLMILGGLTLVAGAVLFIAPLMIAGMAVLVIAFFGYIWGKPQEHIFGG